MTESLTRFLPPWSAWRLPSLLSPRALVAALLALVALLAHGWALADPPTRAGRIADLTGAVWLYDADAREWVEVRRNQTIGEGDRLRADDGAGAVLTVGSSTLWVDQRSEIEFNAMSDNRVALQIVKGSVGLRLRNQESADEWTLRTLEGRFGFEREGLYRVSQRDRGSEAQTWQGKLRFDSRATDAQPVWMATNEQAEFWWDNGPRTERQPLQRDGFARLMLEDARDAVPQQTASATPYVSPEMTGAEDLGQYGAWQQSPDYGAVWVPTVVVADWAPYRYGRWAWSGRWGWTWVDDMPWGFAPFHYGRWAYWRDRWCWVPGPYVRRPVYSPAMVGWVGGAGVSIGVVVGGRRPPPPRYGAWVPLAPREAWVPPYQHSQGYWRRANPDPRAVTVAPQQRGGQPFYRNERDHGPLYTQRPVAGPLPAATVQPQRSWPPRPGQADGRADGRPFVDRNHDGRPDRPGEGRPNDGRPNDGRPTDVRPGEGRPTDVRPGESRPGDGRPGDNRPGDTRPGDARPGDNRPTRGVIRPEPNTTNVTPQTPQTQQPGLTQPGTPTVTPPRGPDVQRPQDRREGDREAWRNREQDGRGRDADRDGRGRDGSQRQDRQDPARGMPPQRVEQPRVESPRFEQPRVEQPRIEQPRIEQPRVEQPRFERPERPRAEQPRIEAPREQPREQPRVEAPRPMPQAPQPRVEAPRPAPRVEAPRPAGPPTPPPAARDDGPRRQNDR